MGAACTKSAIRGADVGDCRSSVSSRERTARMVGATGVRRRVFDRRSVERPSSSENGGRRSDPTPAEAIDPQFRNLFVE